MKIAIFLLAVAVTVALVAWRRPSNPKIPTDDDVIELLRKEGADLSKPHPIDFFIYVPSEEAAKRVAAALSVEDYSVIVRTAAKGPGWLALASKKLIPTSKSLSETRKRLTALALAERGEYDGWEAKVMK